MKIYQNSEEPIYKQIARQYKEQILQGTLKQGDYLPSIRALAQDLRISVVTTMKAYDSLASEGLVTAAQGKGYFVNAQDKEMLVEQHLRKVEQYLQAAIDSARVAGIGRAEMIQILDTLLEVE